MHKYRNNAQLNSCVIRVRKDAQIKLRVLSEKYSKSLSDLVDDAVALLEKDLRLKPPPTKPLPGQMDLPLEGHAQSR